MHLSTALHRLLSIRELQEEQCAASLERALKEFAQIEAALHNAHQAARSARCLVNTSACSGDVTDRIAGVEDERTAERLGVELARRMAEAEQQVARWRKAYSALRVQRKQAETLVRRLLEAEARRDARRTQEHLDDWFRSRS